MASNRIKKLLQTLSTPSDQTAEAFDVFDKSVAALKKELSQKITVNTIDEVNTKLDSFRRSVDVSQLVAAVNQIRREFDSRSNELLGKLESRFADAEALRQSDSKASEEKRIVISSDIASLKDDLKNLLDEKNRDLQRIETELLKINKIEARFNQTKDTIYSEISTVRNEVAIGDAATGAELKKIAETVDTAKRELTNRINSIPRGGNANRNISIGGNSSVLSKFTDLNLKAGTNVTISYANNNTTKQVDVTFAATGGSGSTRSITSISIDTAAGATAGTDYVYICTAALTLTIPTAVGNTNLYTIKNVGTGTVTIAFTGLETCDGSTTLTLPVQYTSVDLVSDGSNWNVT